MWWWWWWCWRWSETPTGWSLGRFLARQNQPRSGEKTTTETKVFILRLGQREKKPNNRAHPYPRGRLEHILEGPEKFPVHGLDLGELGVGAALHAELARRVLHFARLGEREAALLDALGERTELVLHGVLAVLAHVARLHLREDALHRGGGVLSWSRRVAK